MAGQAVNVIEQIADHLTWEIASGRLADGERIQEVRLARAMGASRGSVREALIVLDGRLLVELVPRRGASVRVLDEDEIDDFAAVFSDLLTRAIAGRSVERPALEPALASICAAVQSSDPEGVVRARDGFLRTLAIGHRSGILAQLLMPLLATANRVAMRASLHADFDLRDSYRWCVALVEASSVEDGDRLEALVRAFVRRESELAREAWRSRSRKSVS